MISFNELIDSANVTPAHWVAIANLVEENYHLFDGFVIIHGTDTMAHSASALSYLLENLNKPVIFTGAQLPIGAVRTDARENFITALELAAARKDGRPMVTEVCIFFNNLLLRGCRAKKVESAQFGAFESANYPPLAECGTRIVFNPIAIKSYQPFSDLKVYTKMDPNVTILRLFPGIAESTVRAILGIKGLKGLVLETYGSGNAQLRPGSSTRLKNSSKGPARAKRQPVQRRHRHPGPVRDKPSPRPGRRHQRRGYNDRGSHHQDDVPPRQPRQPRRHPQSPQPIHPRRDGLKKGGTKTSKHPGSFLLGTQMLLPRTAVAKFTW